MKKISTEIWNHTLRLKHKKMSVNKQTKFIKEVDELDDLINSCGCLITTPANN